MQNIDTIIANRIESMSVVEFGEFVKGYCGTTEAIVTEAEIKRQPNSTAKRETATVANSGGSFEVMAKCGHTVTRNSPRGRKPELCLDCRGETGLDHSEIPEQREQRQENNQRRGGGRRKFEPTPIEDMPDDKLASEKQLERIRERLDSKQTTKRNRERILASVNSGELSVQGAARLYAEVKSLDNK